MKQLNGKVAVVTGAASGIGRSTALRLAEEGCHLTIADIKGQELEKTAEVIKEKGVKVTTHVVDVSERDQVYAFAKEVVERHGKVNVVVNNAGVSVWDSIADMTFEDLEWIFGVNFWGVVHGTKAFLPYLLEAGEGHIVNISSIGGFYSTPNFSAYCSTKFAVRAFTETLYMELINSCVGVTCVHPGGIKTNLPENSRVGKSWESKRENLIRDIDKMLINSPDLVAKKIVNAIKKRKPRIIVGRDAKFLYYLGGIVPLQLMAKINNLIMRYDKD